MIYMEPHQLGWKPLKDSYMNTLPSNLTEEHRELVRPGSFSSHPHPYSFQGLSKHIFTFISRKQEGPGNSLPVPGYLVFWLPAIFPAFFFLWLEWDGAVNFSFLFDLLHHPHFPGEELWCWEILFSVAGKSLPSPVVHQQKYWEELCPSVLPFPIPVTCPPHLPPRRSWNQ